ncbi:hypothetical protein IGI37_002180 [Enterococcus sp. AZ194]|uniref:helix-turn-helix transcriptional regulator n=1 Tax=Enterococcus sp. AZ194 TaxID=2774629 RepID=UPI003F284E6B
MDSKRPTSGVNLPTINLSNLSYLKCDTKGKKRPTSFFYWRLYFVTTGNLIVDYDDQILQVHAGEYCVIKRLQDHLLETRELPVKFLLVEFSCQEADTAFLSTLLNQTHQASDEQLDLLEKIFSNCQCGDANLVNGEISLLEVPVFQIQLMIIYFLELLYLTNYKKQPIMFIESGKLSKEYSRELINEVIHFMEKNLSENITIKELAKHFFISPTSLKKFFKEDTGYSLINYFRTLKMEQAKLWIREDDQLFTTIAQNLGYESIHQFSKTFKRYTGLSPTTYKKSIQSIDEQFDSLL